MAGRRLKQRLVLLVALLFGWFLPFIFLKERKRGRMIMKELFIIHVLPSASLCSLRSTHIRDNKQTNSLVPTGHGATRQRAGRPPSLANTVRCWWCSDRIVLAFRPDPLAAFSSVSGPCARRW